MTPGQRRTAQIKAWHDNLKFYVSCLTPPEQSYLAARYIRKVPSQHRRHLLRSLSVAELALCEVVSRELYGC